MDVALKQASALAKSVESRTSCLRYPLSNHGFVLRTKAENFTDVIDIQVKGRVSSSERGPFRRGGGEFDGLTHTGAAI